MPYMSKHAKCIPMTAMLAGAILAITCFALLAIPGCAVEANPARDAPAPSVAALEPMAMVEATDTDYGAHLNPDEYSPTGLRYRDPDPCDGHRDKPDFEGDPKWKKLCQRHWPDPVPSSECLTHLETAWAVGDANVHPSFERPKGCLP